MGPAPPKDTGKHRYVLLLLEGEGHDAEAPSDRKKWGNSDPRTGVKQWAAKHGLKPIGEWRARGKQTLLDTPTVSWAWAVGRSDDASCLPRLTLGSFHPFNVALCTSKPLPPQLPTSSSRKQRRSRLLKTSTIRSEDWASLALVTAARQERENLGASTVQSKARRAEQIQKANSNVCSCILYVRQRLCPQMPLNWSIVPPSIL